MAKSFYDIDYIIEVNEKRDEQFRAEYDKVTGKISNILIVYTALSLFFIPIAQDICDNKIINPSFHYFLYPFVSLFITSFILTICFLFPRSVDYLSSPRQYYTELRDELETEMNNSNQVIDTATIDNRLKSSYITELEISIDHNIRLVSLVQGFYNYAFKIGMLSILPFIGCLYFHLTANNDKIQKVSIDNINKCCIFTIDTTGNKCQISKAKPSIDSNKK